MPLTLSPADRQFRERFESGSTQPSAFDHRAHVRLAYVYLADTDTDASYEAMRAALHGFLAHHGIDRAKYHDTLTRAWILAVRHFMAKTADACCADEFIDQHPEVLDPQIMLSHYSADLLFSEQARADFVEPDREPIPRYE